jgi:hypothetical protein
LKVQQVLKIFTRRGFRGREVSIVCILSGQSKDSQQQASRNLHKPTMMHSGRGKTIERRLLF